MLESQRPLPSSQVQSREDMMLMSSHFLEATFKEWKGTGEINFSDILFNSTNPNSLISTWYQYAELLKYFIFMVLIPSL